MAVLKQIKFGTGAATPIAQTIVTAASESVLSVVGTQTGINDNDNPSYAVDLNIDGTTLTKDTTNTQAVLKVGTVPAAQVSVADSGDLFTNTNVETVLAELDGKITSTGNAAKKYKVVAVDSPASTSQAEYKLQVAEGTSETYADVTGSSTIVVPKDNAFVTAQLGHVGATADSSTGAITDGSGEDALLIEYLNGSGVYTLVAVPIGAFLKEAEFKDGLAVNASGEVSAKLGQGLEFGGESGENQSIKVKIDSTSEGFLTVGAGGVKLAGVQDAIDAKVAALDFTTDAAVAGQYVAAIEETDGVVAVKTRANVSEAVLTNYAKGTAPASLDVAATDTVNQAIAKLEHQVDAAEAAAAAGATVVAEGTDAGNNMTIAEATDATDGHKTYTINLTDVASAQGLSDEITRAQTAETAIDTAVGLTKAQNAETRSFTPTTNYGTGSTTIMGNMQVLDTQIKANADAIGAIEAQLTGTLLTFNGIEFTDNNS